MVVNWLRYSEKVEVEGIEGTLQWCYNDTIGMCLL